MTDRTRREVLRDSGAALGVGALVGLAGCSSLPSSPLGFLGDAPYEEWLYEPGTARDQDHYYFLYRRLQEIEEHRDEFGGGVTDFLKDQEETWQLSTTGLDADETTWYLSSFQFDGGMAALAGDYEVEDVVDKLEANDFDDEGEYEGYEVFLDPEETRAVGVSGDALAFAVQTREEDAEDHLEIVVDTAAGEQERYTEDRDAFDELTDNLDDATLVFGGTHEETEETDEENGNFEEEIASALQWNVRGETTDVKYVRIFDTEDDVPLDDMEEWVDENSGVDEQFDEIYDVSVDQNGRAGVVSGTVDSDDIFEE